MPAKSVKKRRNFVRDETSVTRCDVRAFNVGFLQFDSKCVNSFKSPYRVLKAVIYHAHEWDFVVQDGSNFLETGLIFISATAAIEVPS